jgi:hypothetical protein
MQAVTGTVDMGTVDTAVMETAATLRAMALVITEATTRRTGSASTTGVRGEATAAAGVADTAAAGVGDGDITTITAATADTATIITDRRASGSQAQGNRLCAERISAEFPGVAEDRSSATLVRSTAISLQLSAVSRGG